MQTRAGRNALSRIAQGLVVEVATELAAELEVMAGWLGLSAVEVLPRGDLAPTLRTATLT